MIGAWAVDLPLPAKKWRSVTDPRDLGDLALLVVAVDGEAVPDVVLTCGRAAIPVIAVVDEFRPWALRDLLLRHSCIRNLITREELEGFDFDKTIAEVLQAAQPGSGFSIGSTWSLPGDPEEYEARRYLSLNSPSMASFLSDLRAALNQMRRSRPTLPWDPAGTCAPPALDQHNRLKGRGPFNLADLIEHAREEVARETLMGAGDLGGWTTLPPPLLILGDSGTGKSLLARLIHDVLTEPESQDGRRGQLVEVAAPSIDTRNFDYEMFGAAAGLWADVPYRVGAATHAAYGTLFLDEIGDMPSAAQTLLLRFFNDLRITIPGTTYSFFSYMQIVAATNREIDHLVGLGKFRNDLRARFRSRLTLPPLRARRREERKRLIDFAAQNPAANPLASPGGAEPPVRLVSHISPEALAALLDHEYRDGNFRELEDIIDTGIARARGANRRTLDIDDLELRPPRHRSDSLSRIVQASAIPETTVTVDVGDLDELLRLADKRDLVVLQDGPRFAAVSDGVTYRVVEDGVSRSG